MMCVALCHKQVGYFCVNSSKFLLVQLSIKMSIRSQYDITHLSSTINNRFSSCLLSKHVTITIHKKYNFSCCFVRMYTTTGLSCTNTVLSSSKNSIISVTTRANTVVETFVFFVVLPPDTPGRPTEFDCMQSPLKPYTIEHYCPQGKKIRLNGTRERVLKRINKIMTKEVNRGRREPHNEKLSDLCSSPPPIVEDEWNILYVYWIKKIHTEL